MHKHGITEIYLVSSTSKHFAIGITSVVWLPVSFHLFFSQLSGMRRTTVLFCSQQLGYTCSCYNATLQRVPDRPVWLRRKDPWERRLPETWYMGQRTRVLIYWRQDSEYIRKKFFFPKNNKDLFLTQHKDELWESETSKGRMIYLQDTGFPWDLAIVWLTTW